jgi:hypothetical protein
MEQIKSDKGSQRNVGKNKQWHNNTPSKGIFHSHHESASFSRVTVNVQYYQSFCNTSYAWS